VKDDKAHPLCGSHVKRAPDKRDRCLPHHLVVGGQIGQDAAVQRRRSVQPGSYAVLAQPTKQRPIGI
jgi:hypothetical protein